MPALRVILGDQLNEQISSLEGYKEGDVVLMAEVRAEATYVRHHKQKIAFLFSAMRHFAQELCCKSIRVRYVKYTDQNNAGSILGEVQRAVSDLDPDQVIITACGEWRLQNDIESWQTRLGIPVDIRDDKRFTCGLDEFRTWAQDRKILRMEYFYREMRKKTGLLMEGSKPAGGQWNYDTENRKKLPKNYVPLKTPLWQQDKLTQEVLSMVAREFADHVGGLAHFNYAVNRDDALRQLDWFIEEALPGFGDYQDAMAVGNDFVHHSLLSTYLNAGLLLPVEVCEAAEEAWRAGYAPLNAVEGFIRQVIGWREYVRGLYWLKMPDYAETNFLNAQESLPEFYWTGETDMLCMSEAIRNTLDHAYAHHIQRLMITGNFALLAGVLPSEINEWYLMVYADAYEWVQLPNTHGMAVFADGGIMASKPYAASGAYINRMSNYCSDCKYNVREKAGSSACPFNYLYWDFIARNRGKLEQNGRMGLVYKNLDRKSSQELNEISKSADTFLKGLR